MSSLATSNATQTSLAPSATSAWHVGISPVFPPSLLLTNDAAIESLLTDIPFLSVGLLGFGVLTFFFVMRKFNRHSFYVFASVIVAFIAGVLDVGQVLTRGREAMDSDTNVSSVLPLLVARELALSLSIGIRFFFFWAFVSLPPRGELPLLSRNDSEAQRHNFLHMGFDMHSGNWMALGYVGGFLNYSLLLAVLLVPLLQILWRMVADFSKFGPVYDADSTLEVALSALFIIKLFANAWLSPLTPRWKTIRDYSPVILTLLIGLGVGVGNIIQFQFSETSLGRLFQAVGLYILVLYVHIASFYERRTRMSMMVPLMENRANNASIAVGGIQMRDRMSTFQVDPATASASRGVASDLTPPRTLHSYPNNRLSSWLIPETEQTKVIQGTPRRLSTMDRFSSLITGWRNSPRQDHEQSRLRTDRDVESGTPPVDAKTSLDVMPPASQRREGNTMAFDAPYSGIKIGAVSPDGTINSFRAVENYSRGNLTPPGIPKLPGSPVFGLEGIMGYHGQPSALSRPSSVQSAGMESLLRQQAELDKNVAELQLFSPISVTSGDTATVPAGSLSIRSDFSLSNFPEPPLTPDLPHRLTDENISEFSPVNAPEESRSQQAILPLPTIVEPQIPQSSVPLGRQSLLSSSARSSTDAAVLRVASRTILGSGGYDVTSFIGNPASPGLRESVPQADKSGRPISPAGEQLDVGNVPATTTRLPADVITSVVQAPRLVVIPESVASPPPKSSLPRRMKQGLPSGIKLNISGPILQPSVERSTAYERPRPVPQTK